MLGPYQDEHWEDENGKPAGGVSTGIGFTISWQNGPLGAGVTRKLPNGAFVETVLDAVKRRLEFYQDSEFKCEANEKAIYNIEKALMHLDQRTKDRVKRQVEGTHEQ